MPDTSTSDDEDDLIDTLEREADNDPHLGALRARRLAALSAELSDSKSRKQYGYGTYTTLPSEKDLLDITTSPDYKRCVVHFFKDDFNRCRVMDAHLTKLAERHLEARFVRVGVEEAPFLCVKLGVKVLPCVIAFVDGVSVERVVGFEGLAGGDDFRTEVLEGKLVARGVLEEKESVVEQLRHSGQGEGRFGSGKTAAKQKNGDTDDDDDWD